MTIAAAVLLLLCAVVVLMAGPRCLPRITASGDAPRLGVAVWLTAVVTVLGCSMAAVTLLVVETASHWGGPDERLQHRLRWPKEHRPRSDHLGVPLGDDDGG